MRKFTTELNAGGELAKDREDETRHPICRQTSTVLDSAAVATSTCSSDQLTRDLKVIAAANRVLASRVSDLDAELGRQLTSAQLLQERLARELRRSLDIEALSAQVDSLTQELALLRSTRLFRWSAGPRRVYRALRRRVGRSR